MSTETKTCLDCATQIPVAARKCPNCQEWQVDEVRQTQCRLKNAVAGIISIPFPCIGYCYLGYQSEGLFSFVGMLLLYYFSSHVVGLIVVAFIIHAMTTLHILNVRQAKDTGYFSN